MSGPTLFPLCKLSRAGAGLALGLMAACAQFPEVDAFPAAAPAASPTLLPLDDLLARAAAPPVAQPAGESLAARAARLKARAALMRGPVHAPETRARLAASITAGDA